MSVTDALTDLRMARERVLEAKSLAMSETSTVPLMHRLALTDALSYIDRACEALQGTLP